MSNTIIIDAGASKTDLMLVNESGRILAIEKFGSGSLTVLGAEKIVKLLNGKIEKVLDGSSVPKNDVQNDLLIVAGISGLNTARQKDELMVVWQKTEMAERAQLVPVNDVVIGLLSGTQNKNAVALISGTGTNCFGINVQGQTKKVAGVDYFADQGSGWEIGFQILRQILMASDGRASTTFLTELVQEKYKLSNGEDLRDFCQKMVSPVWRKGEIAKLADLALSWQESSEKNRDETLTKITEQAIEALRNNVETVMRNLKLEKTPTDLVLIGGLITKHTSLRNPLAEQLKQEFPELKVVLPTKDPIAGAWQLAHLIKTAPEQAAPYLIW